eukprot:CAMPEP_0194313904 /NCGR_PEP_ID=MMETSP0171-20130528/10727_1 /TAXON_ID=218684 /ORGANISM="Corethron pennatum, Strain L29A3" /LENGTH=233 /DNA_ID=CAMNT_0039069053 /DNA_START=112 /DNA_END=813 /DNA_ORIENTATION=-
MTVVLKIGRNLYEVAFSLVENHPDAMLAGLISKRHNDKQGRQLFVEKDGERFRYCLDYAKGGRISLPITKDVVLADLAYFGFDVNNFRFNCATTGECLIHSFDVSKDPSESACARNIYAERSLLSLKLVNETLSAMVKNQRDDLKFDYTSSHSYIMINNCFEDLPFLHELFGALGLRISSLYLRCTCAKEETYRVTGEFEILDFEPSKKKLKTAEDEIKYPRRILDEVNLEIK